MADAYLTLGVKKGCTREEVRAAFRAKAWQAHPDRGGDQQAFIELCSAYKKILKEVRSRQGEGRRTRVAQPAKTTDRAKPTGPEPSRKADRDEVNSEPRQASWEPDLILPAGVGRDGQPAPAPDPNWSPDLVVSDGPWPKSRPEQPPDPDWNPDVVLSDEIVNDGPANEGEDLPGSADSYNSLLRRISARSRQKTDESWAAAWLKALGIVVFLVLIAANVWLCWIAWTYDPDQAERQANSDHSSTAR